MSNKHLEGAMELFAKDGKHLLRTPKGEEVQFIVKSIIEDDLNCVAKATIELYVNIVDTCDAKSTYPREKFIVSPDLDIPTTKY